MGKFRSKLKGQTKGKRWAKGQSSSSNPQTRKYRDLAKSKFFQENLGATGLTSDALKRHDAVQTFSSSKHQKAEQMEEESESSFSMQSSYKTMQTFASDWSDCSNMSFARFLKVFRSDSALHKEMLAILAAITEVIKQNGGSETPTEYYCSLITTLEQIMSSDEKNEDQITAVLSLLNMGIKKVPVPVLRTSFDTITSKLLLLLNEYVSSENNVVMKSIFGVLAHLLRTQELAIWTHAQTKHLFGAILNPFCLHSKPRWRKSAQQAAASIIRAEIFENGYNPASDCVAEFCKQTLDACLGTNSSNAVLVSSVQAGQTTILHCLGLLKDTICYFNKNNIKICSETILRLMTLNYPIVTSWGLQVLHALFSSQKAVATAKLNGQLIVALYDYQPSSADVQPTLAWLAVMQQAHVHLADVDLSVSCAALPRIFSVVTQLWLSQKPEIVMGATRTIEVLIKDALSPACASPELIEQHSAKLNKCFQTIELGLGFQYNHAWHQVLHVISIMFEFTGSNCSDMLKGCLKTLSELRDSYKFSYNNELEHAVGAAVRSMGPEAVLNVISLKKETGELNLNRSWLLPVLRENIKMSTLEYWVRAILPLATYCQKRSVELASNNDGIGAHSAELLHLQLWNLLPSFCINPTDISTGFKSIAKVLGMAISERKELRLAVMASLRKLIAKAKTSDNPDDLAEITRFDKNYLPILFNVYTTKPIGTDEEGQRLAALDTIKDYLTVSKLELTNQLFENAMERLVKTSEEPDDVFVKESILDLIRALVPYQSADNLQTLYQQCIKNLPENKNHKEQKKAYRLLEEICSSESQGCIDFLQSNRKPVEKLLMKSLNMVAVSSKGARLRCMNYLIKSKKQLDHESNLIRTALSEAIVCCKDINERCRGAAYELLNTIGDVLQNHDQMPQFIALVSDGLTGKAQLMNCTILALTSILYNFTGALGQNAIETILDNILTLLVTPTREIVTSCLSFLKIFIRCLPSPMVASFLPKIMKSMCKMTDDCKRHSRLKVRNLLDKLIRKFGCESIMPHVAATDTVMYKRLKNLKKQRDRQKRKQEAEKENEDEEMEEEFIVKTRPKSVEEILADSDSDDFEDDNIKEVKSNKKSRNFDAFIAEDADTIVDFKDPTVASKITASRPGQSSGPVKTSGRKDRGFKTSSDGRLIIEDLSSDSDDNVGKKTKKFNIGTDSDSEHDDAFSTAETEILRDKKRKRSDASSVASAASSKYMPGGSGIHRPVAASTSSVKSGFGSEYKSKKAAGDVKKKGKLDPYAFVPLQRSALNKRKKMKSAGQFKSIIGGAKSGAKKGMKAKRAKK